MNGTTRWMLGIALAMSAGAAQAQLVPLTGVAQVAAGGDHTCALSTAGAVQCWGNNANGQLGDSSTTNRLTPIAVTGLGSGVSAITAGRDHTCALTTAGAVQCWGSNGSGRLGDGSTTQRLTPVAVTGLGSGVSAIAAGTFHTCALSTAGAVQCWGANGNGQLGDASTTQRLTPVAVTGLGSGVSAIAAGQNHTCALTTAGAVQCWGSNGSGRLGDGSTTQRLTPVAVTGLGSGVSAIEAGAQHTCAVTTAGAVQCWGFNSGGQLGDASLMSRLTPVAVTGLGSGVSAIAAGVQHTCALTTAGAVQCWGANTNGQLGDASTTQRLTPVAVTGLGSGVSAIAAGGSHTCALSTAGAVQCWGDNGSGQLGDASATDRLTPVAVTGLGSGVSAIAAGQNHTCALTTAGAVQCWGSNGSGRLGDGSTTQRLTPVAVTGLGSGVSAIAAGGSYTCALTTAGAVQCWGYNAAGQLGDASATDRLTPVAVTGLGSGVSAIAAGTFHTCALSTAGAVQCWGNNSNGQLGDASTTQRLTPVAVTGLGSGVGAITTGRDHTCALTTAGAVQCWGNNSNGQLGDASTTQRLTPVAVTGLGSGVSAIAAGAGADHTCALTSAGAVQCWGNNSFGQLGDASTTQRLTPVAVTGLGSGVSAIASGDNHTCALTTAGAVQCWGYNAAGQLGDNSTTDRLTPVAVTGLGSGVSAIAGGGNHTCALAPAGAVQCWGNDAFGQIGDGGRDTSIPAAVLVNDVQRAVIDLTTGGNDMSLAPASDASGRYVVLQSRAGNLGPANTAGTADIYRVDTQTGDTLLLSRNDDGSPLGADAIEASVSADGELAVFVASDAGVSKVANESPTKTFARGKAGGFSVLMRNLIANSTQRMPIPALPGGAGSAPQIAPGGNAIVYTGPTPAGMGDPSMTAILEVPLIKQPNGSLTLGTPRCLSCKAVNSNGSDSGENANGHSRHATLSADGRYVAWETEAKNLLVGNASPCPDASTEIVMRDLVTNVTQRMSAPSSSAQCGVAGTGARKPKIDWSGRKIVFESDQPLKPGDANNAPDIYLRDLTQTSLTRVSETAAGGDAAGASTEPAISGDGQIIGYVSAAADLDSSEADTNAKTDVHVRSLRQALTRRLSKTRDGAEADSDSRRPALNYNGTQLAFDSDAGNLAPGAEAGVQNVFQRANPLNSLTIFAAGFD